MQGAEEYENKKVTNPTDQIFGVVDRVEQAQAVVTELNQNGFTKNEVGVLSGPPDAFKLDSATGENGFLAKLANLGIDFGDRDDDYLTQYRKGLESGHTIVIVKAKDEVSRKKAHQILKSHGAHSLTLFGKVSVQVLEP